MENRYLLTQSNLGRLSVSIMDDLSSANLSETKRALLQKYLHGELTLNGARRINARAEQDLSALPQPSPRSPLRPPNPRLSTTDLSVARPVTLMFEAQAKRSPAAIAAVCEDQVLTYDALNRKANQLAHHLRKR